MSVIVEFPNGILCENIGYSYLIRSKEKEDMSLVIFCRTLNTDELSIVFFFILSIPTQLSFCIASLLSRNPIICGLGSDSYGFLKH